MAGKQLLGAALVLVFAVSLGWGGRTAAEDKPKGVSDFVGKKVFVYLVPSGLLVKAPTSDGAYGGLWGTVAETDQLGVRLKLTQGVFANNAPVQKKDLPPEIFMPWSSVLSIEPVK